MESEFFTIAYGSGLMRLLAAHVTGDSAFQAKAIF